MCNCYAEIIREFSDMPSVLKFVYTRPQGTSQMAQIMPINVPLENSLTMGSNIGNSPNTP